MIRQPQRTDLATVMALAAQAIGPERAGPVIRSHVEQHHLLVAEDDAHVVGVLAYRTDWFQCTLVSLVCVREDLRRRGVARALYQAVE